MFVTSMVRLSIIAASLAAAAGTAAAFSAPSCGTLAAPAGRRAAVSAPALRMGIGDMFEKAFANNPNIPTAPAVGPGSPGFSKQKPQEPKKTRAAAPPSPPPPAPAVWQQATDPASGNPYWYNAETGESSWTPPAVVLPPPMPVAAEAPPASAAEEIDENTVIQLQVKEEEDNGPTGPSLERQLINLNKFLVSGLIDQEEYDEQKAAIKAQMPKEPVFDASSLERPFTTTTMKWGALVDTKIPQGWVEGKDYDRQTKVDVGSLVGVSRSDGSVRFAQVVKKSGFFYEDFWQVVVSMKDDGTPGATRIEEGVMLMRPLPAGLGPVLEAMPKIEVKEVDISEQLGKKDKGFLGNMFAEPVFEGGSAYEVPAQAAAKAAPPKAVVPSGVLPSATPPKAVVPAGVIPTATPPATANPSSGVTPTSTTTLQQDANANQSEWI